MSACVRSNWGAFDCVAKPRMTDWEGFDHLSTIVRAAAGARMSWPRPAPRPREAVSRFEPDGRLLAIGSSTGGVEALMTIISHFPANCPATVITQHMPATFTNSFAKRLDRSCPATVMEAVDGAPLTPGHIYLAPGGETHLEVSGSGPWRCRLRASGLVNGHRPSVDALFASVAKAAGVARARGDPDRDGARRGAGPAGDAAGRRADVRTR